MKRKSGGVVVAHRIDVLLDHLYHLFAHETSADQSNCLSRRNQADEPRLLSTSFDHFDVRTVTWRFGERRVAGHNRSIERLAQGYVHGVVRRDVLAQLPRASEEIEMGVTVEIEVGEIRNRLGRSVR